MGGRLGDHIVLAPPREPGEREGGVIKERGREEEGEREGRGRRKERGRER